MNLPKMNAPKVMNLRYWLVTWCIHSVRTLIMLYFSRGSYTWLKAKLNFFEVCIGTKINLNTWLTVGFFGPVFLGLKSNSDSGQMQTLNLDLRLQLYKENRFELSFEIK